MATFLSEYWNVFMIDKFRRKFESTKMKTGRNAAAYMVISFHWSLLSIIRITVAANADIIIDTEMIRHVTPRIRC